MKKKLLMICVLALGFANAYAQETKKWYDNFKISGYGMLQYQADDKEGSEHNEFNLRLLRLIFDGKILLRTPPTPSHKAGIPTLM